MKNLPLSKTANAMRACRSLFSRRPRPASALRLLAAVLLLHAPLSRAQTTIATDTIITGTLGTSTTYNSGGGTTNRFTVGTGVSATFALESSATMTFTGNNTTANGGAFAIGGPNTRLVFTTGDPNSWFVFSGNTAGRGAAIEVLTGYLEVNHGLFQNNTATSSHGGAVFITSGTAVINNSVFQNNVSASNDGGAVNINTAGGVLTGSNILFQSNTASSGGALSAVTPGIITLYSSTFLNNVATAAAGGGAFFTNNSPSATFNNVVFQGNRVSPATANNTGKGGAITINGSGNINWSFTGGTFAGNAANNAGGAIYVNAGVSATLSFNGVIFQSNTAGMANNANGQTAYGGAIDIECTNGATLLNLNDTTFLNNVASFGASTSGRGGAIYFAGGALAYTATTSATMAGNRLGGTTTNYNGIYFAGAAPTTTATFNTVNADSHIDMLDPMIAVDTTLTIDKTGLGTWNLGGSSTIGTTAATGNIQFNVDQGTLNLYRAATTVGAYTANAGNITINGVAGSAFHLASTATLSVGGGNTIAAPAINLDAGSGLIFDLSGISANNASLLNLNATTAFATANWAQNLTFNNLAASFATSQTFSLINLAGATGSGDGIFDLATNLLATNLLPGSGYSLGTTSDGLTLLLLYTFTSAGGNRVLLWNGAADNNLWSGTNFAPAAAPADPATTFAYGDIVNLANANTSLATPVSNTIAIDTAGGATLSALYVSGTENYTLTGTGITTDATAGDITGAASNGKLTLGAQASDDGSAIDTTSDATYTGTLTLANAANNFTGGIDINTGELIGNAANLGVGATGSIAIAATGTLAFDQAGSGAYAGLITGVAGATLIKQNTGALTLAADNSAFAGTTDINAGALFIAASAALGGNIRVNTTGTLGGAGAAGTAGSTVTIGSGATLLVGDPAAPAGPSASLSILGDLAFADGSILNYTNIGNTLFVGGAVNLPGSGASTFNIASFTSSGSFALIDAGAPLAFTTDLFTVYNGNKLLVEGDGNDYIFSIESGTLWLDILNVSIPLNNLLTWTNANGDHLWLTSANWAVTSADTFNGTTKAFEKGDIVLLTGTDAMGAGSSPYSITLADTATASAIYVSGTTSYALVSDPGTPGAALTTATGVGDLGSAAAANGKLVLGKTATDSTLAATAATFTGTLDLTGITGQNNFTGGIEFNSGELRVATAAQLGAPLSAITFPGTGTLSIAATMTLDGNGAAATQRLSLAAGNTATFILDDNVTLTIQDNTNVATPGAAITLGNGASLTLNGGTNARYVFTGNQSTTAGGALQVSTNARLNLTNFLISSNTSGNSGGAINIPTATGVNATLILASGTFENNTATAGNGGAINLASSSLTLTDVYFGTNSAVAYAGAIMLNTSASALIQSTTFQNNTSSGPGGAISLLNGANTATLNNVAFIGNTATGNGGAMSASANANGAVTITATTALFKDNKSGSYGGAISAQATTGAINFNLTDVLFTGNSALNGGAIGGTNLNAANIWNLTDASFLDNTATTLGGAIFIGNPITLNLTIATSATIAGNTATGNGGANSINWAGNGGAINVNLTTASAHLDMPDPIASTGAALVITQTGPGTWNLGGNNTLAAASFNVKAGTLNLYKSGPTSAGYTAATGSITLTTANASFNLSTGATLQASLANAITVTSGTINLAPNSILAFDMANATAGPAATSLLTLSANTFTTSTWSQYINLLDLSTLATGPTATGSVYNLLTITGAGATGSSLFSDASFGNLTNLIGDAPLTGYTLGYDGNTLQLLYNYTLAADNRVLLWNGAAGSTWTGNNWLLATSPVTGTTIANADIINLSDSMAGGVPAPASGTLAVNAPGATVAGMNIAGAANYTITGNPITTSTAGATLTGPAANAKLTLGAIAADAGAGNTTLDTTTAATYTGTLTLANTANNFTNGIDIHSGALVGNAANLAIGASSSIAIDAGATLAFDQSTDATYAGRIAGAGAMVMGASSSLITLTLTANNASFTGTTTVASGKLLLAPNAALGGNITINNSALLGGSGTAGSVTINNGATLQVGLTPPASGALTLTSNLNLLNGSLLTYTNLANPLLVGGAVSLTGTGIINIPTNALGTYALIGATGGYTAGFDPSHFDIYYNGTLLDAAYYDWNLAALSTGTLFLDITSMAARLNNVLTWANATGDNAWLASPNWMIADGSGTKAFAQGDIVNLSDITSTSTLNLNSSATAAAIYVSGSTGYAIISQSPAAALVTSTAIGELSGSAAATGKLVLGKTAGADATTVTDAPFTGVLDLTGITGTNNFAAGIEFNSGALRVATAAQLGAPLSALTFPGTGTLSIAATMTLDGNGAAATQRLNLAASNTATFVLDDNVTLTIRNNNSAATGGAINLANAASLTLNAGANSRYIFTGNQSTTNGGAIHVNTNARLDLANFLISGNSAVGTGGGVNTPSAATVGAAITLSSGTLENNTATGNGGAINITGAGSTLTLANVTFGTNTGAIGGAIMLNTNAAALIQSSTFRDNTATGSTAGGAITLYNGASVTLNNVTFLNNTSGAGNGGAMGMSANGASSISGTNLIFTGNTSGAYGGALSMQATNNPLTLNLTNATFTNNRAASGGAIGANNGIATSVVNLNNVSFIGNTATNLGGALYFGSAVPLNYTVTTSATIAGNTASGTANSFQFSAATALTVNITAPSAHLDMLDPFASTGAALVVTQTGPGTWNLGGANNLAAASFNVKAGTLNLYRPNTTIGAYSNATAGSVNLTTANASFNLSAAATLEASRANSITAPIINLAANSILAFDLSSAINSPTAASLLTLTASGTFLTANWSQAISLVNLADLATGPGAPNATYNLLTIAGAAATTNPLTTAAFGNLLNFYGDAPLTGYSLNISGNTLQLLYAYTIPVDNCVLYWQGAAGNTWNGANWLLPSATTGATLNNGDIVNLADTLPGGAPATATGTLNITTPGATIAGMNLSGTTNYTLTGNPLTTTPTAANLDGPAVNGKLTLGALAADDGAGHTTLDTTSPAATYTGTLTLATTGTNNFAAGIDINTGALVGNAASLGTGTTAGIAIAAPGTLVFDQAANATYAAPITGQGALVKQNTATLNLAADNSTFTGATEVAAGALLLGAPGNAGLPPRAAALGGSIHVAPAATFGGYGAAGSVTLDQGAALQVGLGRNQDTGLATPTLTLLGDLTLNAGSLLNYTTNDNLLNITGGINQTGLVTINLLGTNLATSSSYALIDTAAGWTGAAFDPALFDVNYRNGHLIAGTNYLLNIDAANTLWLTTLDVLPIVGNNVLTWANATADSSWLGTPNWLVPTLSATIAFAQGDIVNLADATSLTDANTLTLAATATTSAIYVSGSLTYIITGETGGAALTTAAGSGELAPPAATAGKLVLGSTAKDDGTGNITTTTAPFTGILDLTAITGANNFTNGIEINTGALRVATNDQLGAPLSKITFTGNATASGTLIAAAGSSLLFDSALAANNLNLASGQTANFYLETGATMTFSNNTYTTAAGAFTLAAARLILDAADDTSLYNINGNTANQGAAIYSTGNSYIQVASALIENNTGASANGGAIVIATATLVLRDSTLRANTDPANNGGAIAATGAASRVDAANTLFDANTANQGGVLFDNGNGYILLFNTSTFLNNAATGGAGGVFFSNVSNVGSVNSATFNSVTFQANSASTRGGALAATNAGGINWTFNDSIFTANTAGANGGAIETQTNVPSAAITANNTLFQANTSGASGGVLAIDINTGNAANAANYHITLNDTSLLDNTAATSGGAIYMTGGNLTLTATTSATIAGNAIITPSSTTPNAIYFDSTAPAALKTLTVDIATGANLDMLDPIATGSNVTLAITKTGAGTWNLGGDNTLGALDTASITFAVNQGALHLYRAGETSGAYAAPTGNITITGGIFTLANGATLSAGGANTITAPAITLAANSTLALDLIGGIPNSTTPILTLAAPVLNVNAWSQTLNLLNLGDIDLANGDTINLITINGGGASSRFTTASFASGANIFTLLDGYTINVINNGLTLQLAYSTAGIVNSVLTWTGATNNYWRDFNWQSSLTGSAATYTRGDIYNLTGLAGAPATTDITVKSTGTNPIIIAAMYVAGADNYTITGNPVTTDPAGSTLDGKPAANGKLTLGACATPDATAITTLDYTGTLTLANLSNNFTNGIDILSGALVGNAANLATGTTAGVSIAAAATLIFDQPADATYAIPLTGAGAMVMGASSSLTTLTLAADSSSFTGHATVASGKLLLANAALGGTTSVASAATFGGIGSAGSVTLAPAATLQIGLTTQDSGLTTPIPGNLTLTSNLTLADGAALFYTAITNQLQVTGGAAADGATTIDIFTIATGSFNLLTANAGITGLDTALLDLTFRGKEIDPKYYTLVATANQLWLTMPELPNNVITWTNSTADTLWTDSPNWKLTETPSAARPFTDGDIANLSTLSPGNPQSITLDAPATLGALYLSGNTSYAITGSGFLTTATDSSVLVDRAPDTGKLILGKTATNPDTLATAAFTGTLDLTGQTGPANNFTAGVEIDTGALRISTPAQLGTTLDHLLFTSTDATPATEGSPATLIIAANSTALFDASATPAGAAADRLALAPATAGTIYLEPGATLAITHNTTPAATDGAAIAIGAASTLTLATADDTAAYLFAANAAGPSSNGGAIAAGSYATLAIDHALFTANRSAALGGALYASPQSTITLQNTAFTANNATGNGGAIALQGDSTLDLPTRATLAVDNATFTANRGANGGAIAIAGFNADISINNTLFQSNTAAAGGAIRMDTGTGNTLSIANTTFLNNVATGNGGAIAITANANPVLTLTDVNFLGNTSGANGGGAIFIAGSTELDFNIITSATFAGNTSGAAANATPASIYYTNSGSPITTFNVFDGANLDMLDPMTARTANTIAFGINKNGGGTWNLGGASTFMPSNTSGVNANNGNVQNPNGVTINFNINEGTLHLYRAAETSYNGVPVAAATITGTYLGNPGGQGVHTNFTLGTGATLSAGGGNSISFGAITLNPRSILAFDLLGATPNTPAPVLALNASSLTGFQTFNWSQQISLLNFDALTPLNGFTYDLLTLSGSGAPAAALTPAAFNNLAMPAGSPANYFLQLSADSLTLQLYYFTGNNVITWSGGDITDNWVAANWLTTSDGTPTAFARGDIINFGGTTSTSTTRDITTNLASPATSAGIYLSGSTNYTITGAPITTTGSGSTLTGNFAANGKLTLGAMSTPDATGIITTPYTGTLTLSNTAGGAPNHFTAGIDILSGALVGNADTLAAGATADTGVAISAGASLTFAQPTDATYATPITGAGSINYTGPATLLLAADSATFTGTTTVSTGKLLLAPVGTSLATPAPASLGGAIQVSGNATFGGAGAAGDLTLAPAATLQVGASFTATIPYYDPPANYTPSVLTLSTLTLADTAILNYTNIANQLHVATPPAQLTGVTQLNVPDFWATATYNLGNIAALQPTANLTVAGATLYTDARKSANLTTDGDDLILTVTRDQSRAMTWSGSAGNTWALTGADWQGSAAVFGNGDIVTFDDTSTVTTITVAPGGVIAADMLVTGATNYTFNGAPITTDASSLYPGAELAGATATGKLTKTGAATLTLANNGNNFLGGIDLLEGTLAIAATTTAATLNVKAAATLDMTNGNLFTTALTLADTSTLAATASGNITGNIRLDGLVEANITGALRLDAPAGATDAVTGTTITTACAITGSGAYHKTGAGILQLWNLGALGNTGATQIDAGAVQLGGVTYTTATTITATNNFLLNGGQLQLTYGFGPANYATAVDWLNLHVTQGELAATSAISGNNDILHITAASAAAPADNPQSEIRNPQSFLPQLTGGILPAIDAPDTTIILDNLANNFTGPVVALSGTLQVTDLAQIAGAGSATTAKIILNGGAVQFSTAADPALVGDVQIIPAGASILAVDDGLTLTIPNITTPATSAYATGTLVKNGAGAITVTGTMQAPALAINEGRWLALASTDGTPSNNGPVAIAAGATFELGIPAATATGTLIGSAAGRNITTSPNGVISNPFTGDGTLEITTGTLAFTSALTTIANVNAGPGAILAIQTPSFTPAGTITIDNTTLVLAAGAQTLGNVVLKNEATLAFSYIRSSTTATGPNGATATFVTAPRKTATLASLATDNAGGAIPNLWFNADIAQKSADHLAITVRVTGTFAVNVIPTSYTIPATASLNIELIKTPAAGGSLATGAFIIAPDSRQIDIGLFTYNVTGTTLYDGSAYTVNILGNGGMSLTAATIYNASAQLPLAWFSELDTLTQRLGELHLQNPDGVPHNGLAAWTRGFGEKLDFNTKLTGAKFSERHLGGEAGVDYAIGHLWRNYTGLYLGYGQSQRDYNDPTDASNQSTFGGLYNTLVSPTGWYVDAVLKLDRFRNRYTLIDPLLGPALADYHSWATGGSLEIGKRQPITYKGSEIWFLTPMLQAAYTSLDASDYTLTNGVTVRLNSAATTQARVGITFGRDIETAANGTLTAYLKAYYGHQWTTGGEVLIALPDGSAPVPFASKTRGRQITGGAGLAWQFTKATQVYFDYEITQTDYYLRPYGLSLGLRHLW